MPKRKRHSTKITSEKSVCDDGRASAATKNPFLILFDDDDDDNGDDHSNNNDHDHDGGGGVPSSRTNGIQRVLKFLELTKQKQSSESSPELETVVEEIISILKGKDDDENEGDDDDDTTIEFPTKNATTTEKKRRKTNHGLLSNSNLVSILLPWAVKRILYVYHQTIDNFNELPWKALHVCLDCPSTFSDSMNATTAKVLSTSVLHKLLPISINVWALSAGEAKSSDNRSSKTSCGILAGKCYCSLVDYLYRPPFDTLCDTLLPLVANSASRLGVVKTDDHDNDDETELPSSSLVGNILISTLNVFKTTLQKANPKKSFQLMVTPKVFGSLSKIKELAASASNGSIFDKCVELVRAVILEGIFSLEYHLDGFRSMQYDYDILDDASTLIDDGNKYDDNMKIDDDKTNSNTNKKKFDFKGIVHGDTKKMFDHSHCYQEGLMRMVDQLFDNQSSSTGSQDDGGTQNSDATTTASMIKAIPLLLDSFIHQSTMLQEQLRVKPGKSNKKSSYKISQIKFRFFTRITFPLLRYLQECDTVLNDDDASKTNKEEILECVWQNLEIVLRYDVYHPTNTEQSENDLAILTSLMNFVLKTMTGSDKVDQNEWKQVIKILTTLARLNHLILHDSVPTIIANCLTYSDDDCTSAVSSRGLVPETQNLLVTLVDTYQKLRQLDYVFRSFTRLADMLQEENNKGDSTDDGRIHALQKLADDPKIRIGFEKAVQNIPLDQLRKIFTDMNGWIEEASHMYLGEKGDAQNSKNGALVISSIVRLFSIVVQNVRVDMATAQEIYASSQDILNVAVTGLLGDGNLDPRLTDCLKDALLLCTWSIDLKNRCDFWIRNSQEKGTIETIAIPQPIINLINNAMDSVRTNQRAPIDGCQELQFLACYRIHQLHTDIHEKQRIAFVTDSSEYDSSQDIADAAKLARFVLTKIKEDDSNPHGEPQLSTRLEFLAKLVASWAPYAESADIDSFLYDVISNIATNASPIGHKEEIKQDNNDENNQSDCLSSLLYDAGFYEIDGISERVCGAVISCTAGLVQKGLQLIGFPKSQFDETLTKKKLKKLLRADAAFRIDVIDASRLGMATACLKGALECLMNLNGMPNVVLVGSDDIPTVLNTALRLERICASIVGDKDTEFYRVVLQLVSSLRFTVSLLLRGLKTEQNFTECVDKSIVESMVAGLFSSTSSLIEEGGFGEGQQQRNLLLASQRCLRACVEYCNCNSDCIGGLDAAVESSLRGISEFDDTKKMVAFSFGQTILNAINAVSSETEQSIEILLQALKKDAFEHAFSDNAEDGPLKDASLLLVSEIFHQRGGKASARDSLEDKGLFESGIFKTVNEILRTKSISSRKLSTASYLIACLAMTNPSHKARSELASEILMSKARSNGVLESAVCKLIEGMPTNEVEDLIEILATDTDIFAAINASRIRFYRFMVLTLKSSDQIVVIAKFSRHFFFMSLGVLQSKSIDGDDVLCAIELIIDMFRNRSVMTTSERDIAMVLCQLNTALNSNGAAPADEFVPAPQKVFDASFLMVSFLLQRFSKQLHHCVPSVISTLTVILQHSLYGKIDEIEIKIRGQKFTRLCELLMGHKDVYKKHILCLLVEFIQELRGDMDTVRKNSLSPAIYCLLDILQQHETAQLNSMLDDMGRAMFRSLHENYKKVHVYKGQ